MNKSQAHAVLINDIRDQCAPSATACSRSQYPGDYNRGTQIFILVLAVSTATACLRLTPSERPANDAGPTEDTSSSSDTPYQDTSAHPETCDTVLCHERPDAERCAEGKLTIVSGDGYCDLDTDGAPKCRFDTEQVICPTGECEDAKRCKEDPCHGVRCDRPPPNECVGGNDGGSGGDRGSTLTVREREGRCQTDGTDGEPGCLYDIATTIDCKSGCVADTATGDHCKDEPCLGVVCNQPPARFCRDAESLVVWNLFGRCAETEDGSCVYNKRIIDCSAKGGCQNGRCAAIPCDGIICQRPLARYCSSTETAVDFDPVGTCDEVGACVYRETKRSCPGSDCQGGNCGSQGCFESSFCHTPPAAYCNAAGELVSWNVLANCASGRCSYGIQNELCASGPCRDGRCTDDPCEGPQWLCPNGVPAAYCADEESRKVSYPRECLNDGSCDYRTETESCPNRCRAGICE